MDRTEPQGRDVRSRPPRSSSTGKRAVGVDYLRGGRLRRHARAAEVILCGGAINSPQLLQLSGVGNAQRPRQRSASTSSTTCRASARTSRTTSRSTSSTRPSSRSRSRPGLRYRNRPKIGFDWLFFRKGLGATNHFEGGGFSRSNEDVDYPNLMFHFLPVAIRYDGSSPTEGHGYQVHVGPDVCRHPWPHQDQVDRPQGAPGDAVQLPRRRRPTARSGSRRSGWRATSSTSPRSRRSTTASSRPGRRSRPTRRSSTGSPRMPRPRCTRRARPRWASTTCP